MFKHLVPAAACLALAACGTAPEGYDAAQWRKDRRECSAQADRYAANTAPLFEQLTFTAWLDPAWRDNPRNPARLSEALRDCMTARGYP
jgi:hypothetical protein